MRPDDFKPIIEAFQPLMQQRRRETFIAAALLGLTMREPGNVSRDDEEDLAAQAVRLADLTLRAAGG